MPRRRIEGVRELSRSVARWRRRLAAFGVLATIVGLSPPTAHAAESTTTLATPTSAATQAYPAFGLPETSGLASSVLHPGVVWVNEDSGEPIVRAFDAGGTEVASVLFDASDVFGGDNRDTEALAMGPGPTLWSADIGDNDGVRTTVLVHSTPEPVELSDSTVTATSYRFTYPDGPRDAESFLVDPVDGRAYIASKALIGGAGWYAAPSALEPSATHELSRVQDVPALLTDGSFSPDGSMVALRTFSVFGGASSAYVYDVVRGDDDDPVRLDEIGQVELPAQAQGESLAFTLDGRALLVGSEVIDGVEEPIWSVPIPADLLAGTRPATGPSATSSPPAPDPSISAEGSAIDGATDSCGLDDLPACVASPNAILVALLAALVGLLAAMVAVHRRR